MTVAHLTDNTPELARRQLDEAERYLNRAIILTASDAVKDGPDLDTDVYGEHLYCLVKALGNVSGLREDLHDVIGEGAA